MDVTHSIPAGLTTENLARRLGELATSERRVQVDFLLHLDEFDRRRAYLGGYGSLSDYCLRALHLREGAAGRRIGAMRVLRRFRALAEPLRDGRLCLSTASLLGQVLTDENLDELVARAAYKTKEEVDHLVATLRPRQVPREGIRRLPVTAQAVPAAAPIAPFAPETLFSGGSVAASARSIASSAQSVAAPVNGPAGIGQPTSVPVEAHPSESPSAAVATPEPASDSGAAADRRRPPVRVRALSQAEWSLTVTLDVSARKEFELLGALLSHKCGRNAGAILREAIRCGIEKHGKRRGVVAPKRARKSAGIPVKSVGMPPKSAERPAAAATRNRNIPAEVRRQVVQRDGGCCTWTADGGRRCGSRHQVEVDHIQPYEHGGPSTITNLRLLCRAHNLLYAEQVFGREHMARFRKHKQERSDSEPHELSPWCRRRREAS